MKNPKTIITGVNVTIGLLLIISIERFISIVHPFQRGASSKTVDVMIAVDVLLGIASAVPLFMYYEINELQYCRLKWPRGKARVDSIIYNIVQVAFSSVF